MDMPHPGRALGQQRLDVLAIELHHRRVQHDTHGRMAQRPGHAQAGRRVRHEVRAIVRVHALQADRHACVGRHLRQPPEELQCARPCLGIGQPRPVAIGRRPEHQPRRAQPGPHLAHRRQIRQHPLLNVRRAEQVQPLRAIQQRLHARDLDAPIRPPVAHPAHLGLTHRRHIRKILAGRHIDGIHPQPRQQPGHRLVPRRIPRQIGQSQPHPLLLNVGAAWDPADPAARRPAGSAPAPPA